MQTLTSSDEDLLQRAGAGDRQAAAALVRRHSSRMLGVATRMLNDAAEAEDVVQDVFIRIWRAAPRWRPGQAKVSTWMFKIAVNLCLDRLRKPRMLDMDAAPETPDTAASPQDDLEAADRTRVVGDALSSLPDRQRAALTLCYFQELSNIEAAEVLDVSVDALESLLARGRRSLRAALQDQKGALLGESSLGASKTGR